MAILSRLIIQSYKIFSQAAEVVLQIQEALQREGFSCLMQLLPGGDNLAVLGA